MDAHSPLPWSIEHVVASLRSDTEIVNAEFIVRACNNHHDLLAALKEMMVMWSNINYPGLRVDAVIAQARAAIAKAEGNS